MNKSIWEWLEIEPTGEISEIRAAYARQVKKYHPEDTPEEFEQLQKAYKSALQTGKSGKADGNGAAVGTGIPKVRQWF